jgi:hypothetical protein
MIVPIFNYSNHIIDIPNISLDNIIIIGYIIYHNINGLDYQGLTVQAKVSELFNFV